MESAPHRCLQVYFDMQVETAVATRFQEGGTFLLENMSKFMHLSKYPARIKLISREEGIQIMFDTQSRVQGGFHVCENKLGRVRRNPLLKFLLQTCPLQY